jgi:hypothetical protein
MQVEVLKGGWIKQGSVISFPVGWQRPAKTEEWVYEMLIEKKVKSIFVEFIAFPWATLIDLINRGFIEEAEKYTQALHHLPPKSTSVRVTACQHIDIGCVVEYFSKLKITDLFWAHKTKNNDFLGAVRLYPLALYPVAFENRHPNKLKPLDERKYKFSFIGAYDSGCYISNVREKIFKLESKVDVFIKKREYWHFEYSVYGAGGIKDVNELKAKEEQYLNEYVEILGETKYSLCPSGAGPNSLRFWESFLFGAVPVLISKELDVSPVKINYLSIDDKDVGDLYEKLSILDLEKFQNSNLSENYSDVFLGNVFSFFKEWSR